MDDHVNGVASSLARFLSTCSVFFCCSSATTSLALCTHERLSLFGGHRESGETYLQCIVREVHEEISHFIPSEKFEYLTSYGTANIMRDYFSCDDDDGRTFIHGEFFAARNVAVEKVLGTEGTLFVAGRSELAAVEHRLSPSGKAGLTAFLKLNGR